MIKSILFIAYLFLGLFGLYKLKTAEASINIEYILGILSYAASFAIWMIILRIFPISFAFPFAAALLMVGVQVIGYFLLGENMSAYHIAGIFFILIGVFMLGYAEISR